MTEKKFMFMTLGGSGLHKKELMQLISGKTMDDEDMEMLGMDFVNLKYTPTDG